TIARAAGPLSGQRMTGTDSDDYSDAYGHKAHPPKNEGAKTMKIRGRTITALSGLMLAGGLAAGVAHAQSQLDVVWMGWPEEHVIPLMDAFKAAHPEITLNYERIPFNEIFQT